MGGGYKQAPQVNADYFDVLSDYQNAIWIEEHTAHLVVWLRTKQDTPALTTIITIPSNMIPSALAVFYFTIYDTNVNNYVLFPGGLLDIIYADVVLKAGSELRLNLTWYVD